MRLPFALLLLASAAWPAPKLVSLRVVPAQATLQGARASQQFLAIATYDDGVGARRHRAKSEWRLSKPALAKFLSPARVVPVADGSLTLTAVLSGREAASTLKIADAALAQPVSFRREIAGILTKRGCNSAICHGGVKGQGGFKLSAGALYPADDYEWITKGGGYQVLTAEVKGERIPRIDLADPAKSLLLLKPTAAVAHGGGKRFETDSEDYRTILEWIRNGAPYSTGGARQKSNCRAWNCFLPWRSSRWPESTGCWSPRTSATATPKTSRTRRSTPSTTAKSPRSAEAAWSAPSGSAKPPSWSARPGRWRAPPSA